MTSIEHSSITAGDRVTVRDAFNAFLPRRAVTGVTMGHDFEVVWVCKDEEWDAAQAEGQAVVVEGDPTHALGAGCDAEHEEDEQGRHAEAARERAREPRKQEQQADGREHEGGGVGLDHVGPA